MRRPARLLGPPDPTGLEEQVGPPLLARSLDAGAIGPAAVGGAVAGAPLLAPARVKHVPLPTAPPF